VDNCWTSLLRALLTSASSGVALSIKVLCDASKGIQPYHLCSHLSHVLLPFEHEIIENSFTKVGDIRDTVEHTYNQIWISFEIYTSVGLAQARPNDAKL